EDLAQLVLLLVALNGREVTLVMLLRTHRVEASALLGFDAGFLDLAVLDGVEARRLFAHALLLAATTLFFGSNPRLFRLARSLLGLDARPLGGCCCGGPIGLLAPDAILLEAHQLFEREQDRAFLLFRHDRWAPWGVSGCSVLRKLDYDVPLR